MSGDGEEDEADSFFKNNVKRYNLAYAISEACVLILVPLGAQVMAGFANKYLVATLGVIAIEWLVDGIVFTLAWWRLNKEKRLIEAIIDGFKITLRETPT